MVRNLLIFMFTCRFSLLGLCFVAEKIEETAFFFFLVLLQFCHIALQNPRSYPDFQLVLLYFWFHRAQCLIFVFTCHFSSLLGLCFVYEKKEETAFLFFWLLLLLFFFFFFFFFFFLFFFFFYSFVLLLSKTLAHIQIFN